MFVLVLSVILSNESRIETYDFSNKEKCEEAKPVVMQAVKDFYKYADVRAACLPQIAEKEVKK